MKYQPKKQKQTDTPTFKKNSKPLSDVGFFSNKILVALLLFIISFLLYSNTLKHEYTVDDIIVTTENNLVKSGFKGIPELFKNGYFYANTGRNDESYRPLSMVFIAAETELFGLKSSVHHFFNVFYYALAISVLYIALMLVFAGYSGFFVFLVVLVYAVHPIHTEVVANIKSRDEILLLLFLALSVLFLFSWVKKRNWIYLIGSLLSYFAALLSKEVAITFLAIIPLLLYFFTHLNLKKIGIAVFPYIVVFLVYFVLRIQILDTLTIAKEIDPLQNVLSAATTSGQYIATNLTIHLKYIQLLFFPLTLSWDYSINQIPITDFLNVYVIMALFVFALFVFVVYKQFKHKGIFAFAILYYAVTLSITSNFVVKIAATMGERFLFIPSLGFAIAIVAFLYYVFKSPPQKNPNSVNFYIIVFLMIGLFAIRTYGRNFDWKNDLTIYTAGVKDSPNSARTHLTLGSTYRKLMQQEQNPLIKNQYYTNAIQEFKRAIEIYDKSAEFYYNYGYLYYIGGEKNTAFDIFTKGLTVDSNHIELLNYVGIISTERGDFSNGMQYFNKLLKLNPTYAYAYNNKAYIYLQQNKPDSALACFEKAINYNTNYEAALAGAALIHLNNKNFDSSKKYYEQLIGLNSNNQVAVNNLLFIYNSLNDTVNFNRIKNLKP